MIKGYVLIKLVPGLESRTLAQIRSTPGVLDVDLVFGHWDALAVTEAKTIFELTKVVVGQVRGIQGVQDTETLLQGEI
jgi:hypothetical protein